jgi:hypothetical protein
MHRLNSEAFLIFVKDEIKLKTTVKCFCVELKYFELKSFLFFLLENKFIFLRLFIKLQFSFPLSCFYRDQKALVSHKQKLKAELKW